MGGAVAIWHDIVPDGLDEFYAWHGEEHMPERVSIPGFCRGRRFIAVEADLGFFNLYDTESADVVRGADYKARLDAPTPRTLSAVRHFRNVARALCRVAAGSSRAQSQLAQGGLLATLRLDVEEADEENVLAAVEKSMLPGLALSPGIAAVQILIADRAASGYVNAEQRARGVANKVPSFVIVVEGWGDAQAFHATLREQLGAAALQRIGCRDGGVLGLYRHQLTVTRA